MQQALVYPALQVDARGAHVADHLLRRFLEQEVEALLAARAGGIDEVRRQRGLAGAGRAGHQYRAGAVVALAAEHVIQGRRGRVDTRSLGASCSSSSEVTGNTVMPSRLMRNGYSLVPCVEPRYFTTRMRRVEICSYTRWSSEMTASVMYSSRPCRVNIWSPRSAGHHGGDLAVAQPAKQPAQLGAQDAGVLEPAEQRFDGVEHHALGADLLDRMIEPHEQTLEIVFTGFLDLTAVDVDVVDEESLVCHERVEVIAERTHVLASSSAFSSKRHQHSGLREVLRRR